MEKRILVLLAINDNLLALNQLLAFASSLFIFLNNMLTLFRMGIFGAAHGWGPLSKTCHTYPTTMKLCTVIPYLNKIQKTYESRDTAPKFR